MNHFANDLQVHIRRTHQPIKRLELFAMAYTLQDGRTKLSSTPQGSVHFPIAGDQAPTRKSRHERS
jgi:hypothetical protein